ncbi:MAG: response regulator [Opitutaceae bacterium]
MRIALVEDHLFVRDVLRLACGRDFGHEIVAEAAEGAAAIPLLMAAEPDLLVLDLHLPDRDGLEVLDEVRSRRPLQRALILSSRCDPYTVHRIGRAGVCGFIDKGSHSLAMIGAALAAIAEGRRYFSPAFVALRAACRRDPRSFDKLLSEREQSVLVWLCRSGSDREISSRLGIAPETVEKHRSNLRRKLGLHSTAELLRYARAQGFAIPEPAAP